MKRNKEHYHHFDARGTLTRCVICGIEFRNIMRDPQSEGQATFRVLIIVIGIVVTFLVCVLMTGSLIEFMK
jgi:hypothetical protein